MIKNLERRHLSLVLVELFLQQRKRKDIILELVVGKNHPL
jgi:hypothetical protein